MIHKNLAIQQKSEGVVVDDDEPPLYEEENPVEDTYNTSKEDEEELRRTVAGVFELEEALLSQHMSNIQENAEMLTQGNILLFSCIFPVVYKLFSPSICLCLVLTEGKLLQSIQAGGMSEDEMDK